MVKSELVSEICSDPDWHQLAYTVEDQSLTILTWAVVLQILSQVGLKPATVAGWLTLMFPSGSITEGFVVSAFTAAFPELGTCSLLEITCCLLVDMLLSRNKVTTPLDFVECFSGMAFLSRNLHRRGFRGHCFDAKYHTLHNLLSPRGLRLVWLTLRWLGIGALAWFAPPCSSWGFLCAFQSKRRKASPYGDAGKPWVLAANQTIAIVSFMALLCWICHVDFVLETSKSSLIGFTNEMVGLVQITSACRTRTFLGAFGSSSPKEVKFWGTAPWLGRLWQPGPLTSMPLGRLCRIHVDERGRKRVSGKRKSLQLSEHYPDAFGKFVASLMSGSG